MSFFRTFKLSRTPNISSAAILNSAVLFSPVWLFVIKSQASNILFVSGFGIPFGLPLRRTHADCSEIVLRLMAILRESINLIVGSRKRAGKEQSYGSLRYEWEQFGCKKYLDCPGSAGVLAC